VVTTFQAKNRVTMMVNDNGDGIAPEVLPNVFEPFATTKEEEGASAGLGLHCALKAVEGHGGTIKLRSKPGEGTTVTVVLPLTPGVTKTPASGAGAAGS
jgi:signal transduction histidine kinase